MASTGTRQTPRFREGDRSHSTARVAGRSLWLLDGPRQEVSPTAGPTASDLKDQARGGRGSTGRERLSGEICPDVSRIRETAGSDIDVGCVSVAVAGEWA